MSSPIHHFLLTYILEAFFLAFLSYIGNPQLLIKQKKLTERDTNIVICCLQTANKTEFCCLQTANNYIPYKIARTTKAAIHLSRLRRDDIAAHYGLNSCKAIS